MSLHITISGTVARALRRGALLAVLGIVAVCTGCGGSDQAKRATHAELMSNADMDSLGLVQFMALSGDERALRRERAGIWRSHAADSEDAWGRAESLRTAVGLAPDDPDPWLDLAETSGWLGDDLRVENALLNATAALRHLNEPASDLRVTRAERDDIVVRVSLLRAWFHYRRAEWHEGLGWAKAALQVKPGAISAAVIKGLLAAGAQQRAQAGIVAEDMRLHEPYAWNATWILAMIDLAYEDLYLAFNRATRVTEPDEHSVDFFRDIATIAEFVEEWSYARRWYADSAAALHPSTARHRRRVDHPRLGEGPEAVEMPVWLSFDRYYLTGSLPSYAALVYERFTGAPTPGERTRWGGETVNAVGILLRQNRCQAHALRVRGLVFLDQERYERARADLERAERLFDEAGTENREVVAALGRLWLNLEDHEQALPYLERACLLSPMDPDVWSDLGLVRVMARDEEGAAEAFGRAIEIDPDAAAAWYNRGLMRLHAGDLDGATVDLGEAARLAPDNAEVGRLLQRIRVMQREAEE